MSMLLTTNGVNLGPSPFAANLSSRSRTENQPAPALPVNDRPLVTISPEAHAIYKQEQRAEKPPLSKLELNAIYQRTHGLQSWKDPFISQMNTQGKDAELLKQLPMDQTPERIAQAKKVADFVYSAHTSGNMDNNPYQHLSRDELSAILYDESGNHTPAERYAASITRQDKDFAALTENSKGIYVKDKTPYYQGLLDFFDALSAIERSQYPEDYRERYVGYLKQAERERDADQH
ncbi:MAG: hypothetical protein JWP80_4693 [Pseudomonas sp.]|nr:hypothetical protein [Pseudomonas sp.]